MDVRDHKEGWRTDLKKKKKNWCFRTVVLDKIPESPWASRRSNLLILKEVNPEYLLEELMLKLKLQNFGYLMRIANSLEKTLFLGTIEGRGRRGRQRMRWLANITDSMDMSLSKLWEMVDHRAACCATVHGVIKSQTRLSNWTTATTMYFHFYVT